MKDGFIKRRELLTMIIMLTKGKVEFKAGLLSDLYAEDDYITLKNFELLYETWADIAIEIVTGIHTIKSSSEIESSILWYLRNIRKFRPNALGAFKKHWFGYSTKIPVYLFKAFFTKKFSVVESEIKTEVGASLASLTSTHQFRKFLADLRV